MRFLVLILMPLLAAAQQKYPPEIPGARAEVYKQTPQGPLNMYVMGAAREGQRRPAIVFFFGGGWSNGSPAQFRIQAEHLVDKGIVAFLADYRVYSRQHTTIADAVADAKSAVRWIRVNAERLGVDDTRIVAAGGSAGGHLAAAAALLERFDEKQEDAAVSSRPNALVLFNPAIALAAYEQTPWVDPDQEAAITARAGADPKALSPLHHVREGAPPTLIFHGEADTTVPFAIVEKFAILMKRAGNRCELISFPGEKHGFFNTGRAPVEIAAKLLRDTDVFLGSLGYLK